MIRETSRQAYEHLRDSGDLTRRQRECMTAIHLHFHGKTFTRKRLAAVMERPINAVVPRVLELLQLGYLEEQGTTIEDGRSAHLLAIRAAQMELEMAA